ncbi:hypothetical protein ON010_g1989 [Phytophthora cinnamomi]|nr:hypothetical protein ON010_g1989 [Phytophthora cinnamomi]
MAVAQPVTADGAALQVWQLRHDARGAQRDARLHVPVHGVRRAQPDPAAAPPCGRRVRCAAVIAVVL